MEPPLPDFLNLTTTDTPPVVSPLIPPKPPATGVGYNPRKVAKNNLRPNPKPSGNPDFRQLDAMTSTELKRQDQESRSNRSDYFLIQAYYGLEFLLQLFTVPFLFSSIFMEPHLFKAKR